MRIKKEQFKNKNENKNMERRRKLLEKELKIELKEIGKSTLNADQLTGRNIENLIGVVQVPLGVAGPLKIRRRKTENGRQKLEVKSYYVPLATTEGALVASVNRGCKATRLSGGVKVRVENVGATRAPVFEVKDIEEGEKLIDWTRENFNFLKKITEKMEKHLRLSEIKPFLVGRNVYLRFCYDTDEAMGMNMVTIGTQKAVDWIEKKLKIKCISITGNLCVDKKPSWMNFILGRGKRVWAEAVIKPQVVKEVLKTTAEKIIEVVLRKDFFGSALAGAMGFNGHYANIVAAVFLATGQDMAHVVEGSLGITTAEVLEDGDLYFSVYLPDLMVGTVGGGTGIATQKEALAMMGLGKGIKGEAMAFAQVVGAAVLAGELSLTAALSAGHLARAHARLGRRK